MEDRGSSFEGWTLINQFKDAAGIPYLKYRSNASGMTVALAQIEGPSVYGYFVLATEANDDFGCPHTLEHAIFLGSELYPYKGVLDSLANRCLARGTNAWTDVDHTCYTIEMAGSEGFLNILPIYLDHVLYPTLTDSGFYTEVHHITGEGANAGVVYCEMQARENTGSSILHRKMVDLLYADCGYKSETGGIMADLRKLTAEQVRAYHKAYYRPDNLCLIIAGKVPPADLFRVLEPVEARIKSKGALPHMDRPWSTPVPPYKEITDVTVAFPSDDESSGSALIAWRGPKYNEFEKVSALRVMWKYLTYSSVSPVIKNFVDIPDPYCSEVTYSFCENSEFVQYMKLHSVPAAKMALLKPKFFEVINAVVSEGVDMERIRSVINRMRLRYLSELEASPHDKVAFLFIGDFLYGSDKELEAAFSEAKRYEALLEKDSKFWTDLIKSTLLDQPYAFILGEASKAKAKEIADTDAARIAAQKEALGEARLAELEQALENAIDANEVEIPIEELEKVPIPDASKIPFIPVDTYRNVGTAGRGSEKIIELLKKASPSGDVVNPPFFVQLDNVPSIFVETNVLLDTATIPEKLRPYLQLYVEGLFEVPIKRQSGELIGHEEVVKQLQNDTVGYSSDLGFGGNTFLCGTFAQLISIHLKTEVSKYSRAVEWARDILWNTQFTKERIEIIAQKLINQVPDNKRSGSTMVTAATRAITFHPTQSNHSVVNLIKQANFLGDVLKRLQQDEASAQGVLKEFEEFRQLLCNPSNIRVQVAGNLVDNLQDPLKPLQSSFLPAQYQTGEKFTDSLKPVTFSSELRTPTVVDPAAEKRVDILSMAALESSYLTQVYPGPTSYSHADVSPLYVLIEYLTTMEGPFWKRIRGCGLSYSYAIRMKIESGLLYFVLFKSGSLVKAYEEARSIINQFATKEDEFDETGLEAARSSVIFSVISREETASAAVTQSLVNYLRGADADETKRILQNIANVTVADLQRVLQTYFVPLFDTAVVNVAATVPPTFAQDVKNHFGEKYSKKVTVVESLEEYFA